MGPSKILTVSYGTFSCTLEGFDDPFATMRGIAEYFRDLAAEDRYFGAEPPQPDAEMLHRIAEREVQRRVEARVGDNSVVLRQLDGDPDVQDKPESAGPESAGAEPSDAASARPGSAAAVPTARIEAAPADSAPAGAAPEPAQPMAQPAAPTEAAPTETVAGRLARIRAVVAEDRNAYTEDEEDAAAPFVTAPISAAFEDVADLPPAPRSAPENAARDAEPVRASDDGDQDAGQETSQETGAETGSDGDSLAQMVAAAGDAPDAPDAGPSAGPGAGPDAGPQSGPQDEAPAAAEATATAEEDVLDQEFETEFEAFQKAEALADPDAPAIARVVKMRREDFEGVVEAGGLAEVDSPEPDATVVETVAEPVAEDEAEVAQTETAEADDNAQDEQDELSESTLSPEDEAELMATLEAVQRKAEAEARAENEGRAMLETQDIEASADSVSRILEVTNSEMEESEGTRRRSAIAHLKAAVAATRADKLLSRKKEEDAADEMNQYRADLAKVVRPRRPSESEMPKKRRVAPLVLVSEQRVDAPEPAPAAGDSQPVRPRLVSAGNLAIDEDNIDAGDDDRHDNIFVDPGSFREFAAEMGAHDLPDLLEAAAAYTSFVEGNAFFSRPQIMKAVAQLNEDKPFSREESLRSFGLLLRRGKIRKIKRGQFAISETTRFKPQQTAVGE